MRLRSLDEQRCKRNVVLVQLDERRCKRNVMHVAFDEHHFRRNETHFSFDEALCTNVAVVRGPSERHRRLDVVARVYQVMRCKLNAPLCKLNEPLCKLNERLCKLNLCLVRRTQALRVGNGRNS
jgi:hypothetical protein